MPRDIDLLRRVKERLAGFGAVNKLRDHESRIRKTERAASGGGTVTNVTNVSTAGGAGSVATDTIWDAKGDLAAGTGADAASKLTVGADDTILMADAAQATGLKWVASATPSTQAFGDAAAVGTGDTFTRGDHKHAMPADPVTAHVAAADPHTGYVLESVLDAKGDLITATADNTPAKLTVGANGMPLIADSAQSSGLRYGAIFAPGWALGG